MKSLLLTSLDTCRAVARKLCMWSVCAVLVSVFCSTSQAKAADELSDARTEQSKKFAAALERLAGLAEKHGLAERAKFTRTWHVERDPQKIYIFDHDQTFVPENFSNPRTAQQRVWLDEFKKLRQAQARWLFGHARRAAEVRQVSMALELINETLHEDPDHGEARRILGYEKVDGRWLTSFEAKQQRRGLVWHDKFGWIAKADVARYERGERKNGTRWVSAEDDARLHSSIERGWNIDTEHYRVTTNHSLEEGARLAEQLEQLYRVWRQVFAGYMHSQAKANSWFRDGRVQEPKRRFEVVYFRTRDGYNDYLRKWQPRIEISLGFYSDRQRKAYFFGGKDQSPITLFHEATHQLFSESRATRKDIGEASHFWILEGIACYMESLDRGRRHWTVGGAEAGRIPDARIRLLRDAFYIPFADLTAMGRGEIQRDPRIAKIYSQISGQAAFLMHAADGQYRDALTDYLALIYTTARLRDNLLEKLTGTKHAKLDEEYRAFMSNRRRRVGEEKGGGR